MTPASARSRRRAWCGSSARGRRRSSCAGRRCRARRRWPGRRSRSSRPGRGSAPCDSTRRGLRIRKRSSSNSVAVSVISSPSRNTSWLSSSSVEVADDQHRRRRGLLCAGPPHQRAQPGDQLLEGERLGDVVVAAGGQAGDPVLDGVAGGQEHDGYVGVGGAHPAQHLEAVEVGQHHVEDDGVGPELLGARRPPSSRCARPRPPSPRSAAPSRSARRCSPRRRRRAPAAGIRRVGSAPCRSSCRG